jgi:glycosyltransferase involved in cell wall biosynthesis
MSLVVGVDASRIRSGGAIVHLRGTIEEGDPLAHGIREVHVWGAKTLLDRLPARPWLVTHRPRELNGSLLRELWWQRFVVPIEARRVGCSIMLSLHAGSVSTLRPAVTMSQDLLAYEPREAARYGISRARLRLWAIRQIQNWSLSRSDGAVFLTRYAAETIQKSCGPLSRVACIPHGVGRAFKDVQPRRSWPGPGERPVECLYVSNAELYKHQWVVIRAFGRLRAKGYDVRLTLIGGGTGKGLRLMNEAMAEVDPHGTFVRELGALPHEDLPGYHAASDLFVFASSCEAFGITLVEAMSAGLPIACSNRSCLPEVIEDGCVYFDPESPASIASAVEHLLLDANLRARVAARARQLSEAYSWARCASEIWEFVAATAATSERRGLRTGG